MQRRVNLAIAARNIMNNQQNILDRLIFVVYNLTIIIILESYIIFITKSLVRDKIGRQRTLLAYRICSFILGLEK